MRGSAVRNGFSALVGAMATTVLLGTLDAGTFADSYELSHRFFFPLVFGFNLCVGLVVGLGSALIAGVVTMVAGQRSRIEGAFVALFFGAGLGCTPTLRYETFGAAAQEISWLEVVPPVLLWLLVPALFGVAGSFVARARVVRGRSTSWVFVGGATVIVICGAVSAAMMWRSDSTIAVEFPPATNEDLPNVALLVADNLRADHLGCYGYERPITPNLDRLSGEGVRFSRVVSTSNYTPPPHATLLTGNYPSRTGVVDGHRALPEANVTLAEMLADRGYATIGVVSNLQVAAMFGYGQGFDVYDDSVVDMRAPIVWLTQTPGFALIRGLGVSQFSLRALVIDRLGWISSISAARTNKRVFHYLDQAQGRPWFLFVNYIDPHFPWSPPQGFEGEAILEGETLRDRDDEVVLNQVFANVLHDDGHALSSEFDAEDLQYYVARYDREIEYLDSEIQRLVARLAESGELDRTIFVVTADHGEHFGEHGLLYHHNSFYEELVMVPLIMRYPDVLAAGTAVERVVSLVDVPATILEMVGIDPPNPIHGTSLLPFVDAASGDAGVVEDPDDLLSGGFAVSEWESGRRLLATKLHHAEFVGDSLVAVWAADVAPDQRRNVAPEEPELAAELTRVMTDWLETQGTGHIRSRDVELDVRSEERLRALGYVD